MCNQVYKDLLVSYLYDDINDMDRAKVDMHLRACEECRTELNALRGVRVDLGSWAPPLPDLGFRIVRDAKASQAKSTSWRSWLTPVAGLAAAATLVFAAALSLARIEIHDGPDGFTIRTGVTASGPVTGNGIDGGARGVPARDVYLASDEGGIDLVGISRRIDALESALKDAPETRDASALNARASDEALIKRVREMLTQSETRQQSELALRIGQVIRDFDYQRRADLQAIQASFVRMGDNMTKEAQLHTDLVNFVTNGAGKQK
jgi:putative zinc finger protein